jgi:hypothetical protein
MWLYNLDSSSQYIQGKKIEAATFFEIPLNLENEFATDSVLASNIILEKVTLSVDGINIIPGTPEYLCTILTSIGASETIASFAIDKILDQVIETDAWTKLEAHNVLWDFIGNYDIATDCITIYSNGVYDFDAQVRFKDLVNVASIELALFKVEKFVDDYWFIIAKSTDVFDLSIAQLSGSTQFDFRASEKYYFAVKLEKIDPESSISATVDKNDDYTAWGLSWVNKLI